MRNKTIMFLRLAIILVSAIIFVVCAFMFYYVLNNPVNPKYAASLYPIITGLFLTTIPFYTALYKAMKLLGYIDKNQAFTSTSVRSVKNIKICAGCISILYMLMMPFIFILADTDDAPGAILMGLVPIFISAVICVGAYVFQKLLQQAVDIKNENDLTI